MMYTIVYAEELDQFTQLVNEHIMQGWLPQGGVYSCDKAEMFLQAMVRSNVPVAVESDVYSENQRRNEEQNGIL